MVRSRNGLIADCQHPNTGRIGMPSPEDPMTFFARLSSSLDLGRNKVRFDLLEARLERAGKGGLTARELKDLRELAPGDVCIMKLRIKPGLVTEYTMYIRFDVKWGYELEYKGISLSGFMPFGVLCSKEEKAVEPQYRSTRANIELLIETLVIGSIQSLLTSGPSEQLKT